MVGAICQKTQQNFFKKLIKKPSPSLFPLMTLPTTKSSEMAVKLRIDLYVVRLKFQLLRHTIVLHLSLIQASV